SLAPDSSMPSRSEEDSRSEFCPRSPWANILIVRRGCVSPALQDVRPLTSSVRIGVRNEPSRPQVLLAHPRRTRASHRFGQTRTGCANQQLSTQLTFRTLLY